MLDHYGIDRAVIVGASAGGPIALLFALTWPERVIGLALPNTGPALMSESPEGFAGRYPERVQRRFARVRSFLEQVEGARSSGDRAWFESRKDVIRHPRAAPGSTPPDPEVARREREAREGLDDETLFTWYTGMLRNYAASEGRDFTARLGEIDVPTFIVHGTADLAVPIEYGELLHERIPGSVLHTIEGAGHGIVMNPEAQRLLREWIVSL